jgi:hypothetical protein
MTEPFSDLTYMIAARERARLEDARYLAEHGDSAWKINDSSWEDYSADVYFPGLGMALDTIVERLDCQSSVGLDIAGGTNGRAMLDLIHRGILSRAAVTNYEDLRSDDSRSEPRLDHLAGDLREFATWKNIVTWRRQIAAPGLKLVIHVPRDALQWEEPSAYRRASELLVDNLAVGGLLDSQIPARLSQAAVTKLLRTTEARHDVMATDVSNPTADGTRHALILSAV